MGKQMNSETQPLRYFSTFSGIGGFEVGIHSVAPNAECVGYSEIDKYASSVYQHHFKGVKNYGDITQINPGELPKFDLFVGGFPCQAFSVAGKRLGFDDTRGTLFFEVARLLKAKRPRHLVLENVKGLLSHDGGKTFATILGVLSDLGYFVEWQVLNSKNFGVPQNRERIYIVGHFGSAPKRQVFPLVGSNEDTRNSEYKGKLVDLTRRAVGNYRERTDGRAGTLDANYYKGLANQARPGVLQQAVVWGSPAIDEDTGEEIHWIRRLTPKECERLQGFPDDWTKYLADGKETSDTQRYKMCGNAVTTNVVAAVIERIFNE